MNKKLIGGVFFIAGTSIGAAALALPIAASALGFFGTFFAFFISWQVMYSAGLMVLEVSLACKEEHSFISMTEFTLGPSYKWPIAIAYSVLLYSLLAAYFTGGADLAKAFFSALGFSNLPLIVDTMPFMLVTALVVFLGAKYIDYLNRVMVTGLILSFLLLLFLLLSNADFNFNISKQQFKFSSFVAMMPMIITAFGYQVVIPSVRHYLAKNVELLPKVIFLGSAIPFVLYFIWSVVIFMVLPATGTYSISSLVQSSQPATDLPLFLSALFNIKILTIATSLFAFFALSSSILGIAISLFDFLADKLIYGKNGLSKGVVLLITLLPPALFSIFYPEGFILALSFAGVFVAILNGILPVIMLYKLRVATAKKITMRDYYSMFLVIIISLLLILAYFY
jgi:tyrosine-specific transport protein